MSVLVDEEKVCRDCSQPFVFAVRDQEFFTKMNFTPPNRCKPCRDKRKAEKGAGPQQQGQQQGRPPVDRAPVDRAPLGVSASRPITEYRPRFEGSGPRAPNPPPAMPSRDDKNDGRRRRGKWRDDSGEGADW